MAEWLYEEGIGENRAALVANGRIWKARIELHDPNALRVGTVAAGRLAEILIPKVSGRVTIDGRDALVEPLPAGVTQGARLRVRIVRAAIHERGRDRLPKAVPVGDDVPLGEGPDLRGEIAASGHSMRLLRAHDPDLLEEAGWSEILDEARTGDIAFPGGALRLAVTPAMSLFDVDGPPPLEPLAVQAAHAVGQAIVRLDIGGSIGIDFPTLGSRSARQAVAEAIDSVLSQPFERTAVNGFGFLQVVRRRSRASLPEIVAADAIGAAARAALRVAERVPPPAVHPHIVGEPVLRRIEARPDWIDELARRSGTRPHFATARTT